MKQGINHYPCLMKALVCLCFLITLRNTSGQIPKPDDAPQALPPGESQKHFTLTGIAFTTMEGSGSYDGIELLRDKP